MKSVKYTALILLCCFLLIGCAEMDSSLSSSAETDNEYSEPDREYSESETETETEKKNTKQKNKKSKKSKSKKKNKEDNSSKETETEKITGEYSTDSDAVEQAKNTIIGDFYEYHDNTYAEEIACGKVFNYYFDYTQWIDVEDDAFNGVEFIGTKYENDDTWEFHLYYSFDGGFIDDWLGGTWLDTLEAYKNGKRNRNYEDEIGAGLLVFKAYSEYHANH